MDSNHGQAEIRGCIVCLLKSKFIETYLKEKRDSKNIDL